VFGRETRGEVRDQGEKGLLERGAVRERLGRSGSGGRRRSRGVVRVRG
jgi:hypothetical protein